MQEILNELRNAIKDIGYINYFGHMNKLNCWVNTIPTDEMKSLNGEYKAYINSSNSNIENTIKRDKKHVTSNITIGIITNGDNDNEMIFSIINQLKLNIRNHEFVKVGDNKKIICNKNISDVQPGTDPQNNKVYLIEFECLWTESFEN